MRAVLSESLPLYSLALIDVAVEAMHDAGGDQAEEEANSVDMSSQFATFLAYIYARVASRLSQYRDRF